MPHKDPRVRRARDRERVARRTAERMAAGLCLKCGRRRPEPGRRACAPCAAKARAAGRARDARLRAAGKPRRNRERARVYERERSRRQTADRIAQGVCTKCGANPAEPDRHLCSECLEKRRASDRARYRAGKAAGALYGGADVEMKRRSARIAGAKRRKARVEAGLCNRCGRRPPVEGGATCEPCREIRQAAERGLYAVRRAARLCTRCAGATTDGGALCAPCAVLAAERGRPERKNARSRERYWERRAASRCTDCNAPSFGASRCPPCAERSYERSDFFRGIPVWDPSFTVIELATGGSHGPFDSEAEAVAELAFAGLSFEEVEIVNDAPVTARLTGWA